MWSILLGVALANSGVVSGGAVRGSAAPRAPVDPSLVTSDMLGWVAREVPAHGTDQARTDALLRALSARGITPDGQTRTGEEVFVTGRYNCLGLATLLVPLARSLGVEAHYVRIHDLETPVDTGPTVVVSGHVAAAFGPPLHLRVVDPVPVRSGQVRAAEPLTDQEVMALYHVNRGAEATLAGHPEAGLAWFSLAEELASELPELWVDRGVALRHLGQREQAQAAFERAIDLDPDHGPAWRNLARSLAEQGDPEHARQVLDGLSGRLRRDPLTQLALGDTWALLGEPARALRAYRWADLAGGAAAALWAARAEVWLTLGDPEVAGRCLVRAERTDPEHPRVVAARRRWLAARGGIDARG